MSTLLELEQKGDLNGLMTMLRGRVAKDRRALTNPHARAWCARRWRFLFLNEAVNDPVALEYATRQMDKRPAKRRVCERFLVDGAKTAWQLEQPEPVYETVPNTTLLLCPGLLNGMLPVRAFETNLPEIEKRFHMPVLRSDSHPMRSCEANTQDIVAAFEHGAGRDARGAPIDADNQRVPKKALVIGYSKGAPDFLTALASHPLPGERTSCMFSWAGAVLGSEASDSMVGDLKGTAIDRNSSALSRTVKRLMPSFLTKGGATFARMKEYDSRGAMLSLHTMEREASMQRTRQKLDALNIPMFFISGAARLADIPLIQRKSFRDLSAFDARNDMQLTVPRTAIPMPMGIDLGIVRGHHWDLAYPPFITRKWLNKMYHPFPKTAALSAMVQLASELGLAD